MVFRLATLAFLLAATGAGAGTSAVDASPRKVKPPAMDIISGSFHRSSGVKNKNGSYRPPFTRVDLHLLAGFQRRPRVGDMVTVVPLNGLPPFPLRVQRSRIIPASETCAGEPGIGVQLETVKDRRYFDARPLGGRGEEFPFDAVLFYPAVEGARLLRADLADLTEEGPRQRTMAAIDLDGDDREDASIVEEFCEGTNGYTCQKVYLRRGGELQILREVTPC